MSDLISTTTVTVELTTRNPTIEDVREALDILAAEGIPETFEVGIIQNASREYIKDVPVDERPITRLFRVTAERAAKTSDGAR